jgi:hypothetical protein
MTGRRTHQVFVSYSSADREVADKARDYLQANGVTCWMAPHDIVGGSDWAAAIIEAIDSSRALLLVLSERSNRSAEVKREVGRASQRGVPIVPFFIEQVALSKHMEYYLATTHWLGADSRHVELRLGHLLDTVQQLLNNPQSTGAFRFTATTPPGGPGAAPSSASGSASAAPASASAPRAAAAPSLDIWALQTSLFDTLRPLLRLPLEDRRPHAEARPMLAAITTLIVGGLGMLFNQQTLISVLAPGYGPDAFVYAMFPMIRFTALFAAVANAAGNLVLIAGGYRMLNGVADGPPITMAAVRWLTGVLVVWFALTLIFAVATGPDGVRGPVIGNTFTTALLAALQIGIVWKLTSSAARR